MAHEIKGSLNVLSRVDVGAALNLPRFLSGYEYIVDDVIYEGTCIYICVTAHTGAATFAGSAANWLCTQAGGNDNVFLSDTDTSPATAGAPTAAEVTAAAATAGATDVIVYYNGTDTDGLPSAATHTYYIDPSGEAVPIMVPGGSVTIVSGDANNMVVAGGDGGALLTAAAALSTDANQLLSVGTDNRIMLETADVVDALTYRHSYVVGDWTGPTGGVYTITLATATHGLGTSVAVIEVSEGGDEVTVDRQNVAAGVVTLEVSEVPDARYAGDLVVMRSN